MTELIPIPKKQIKEGTIGFVDFTLPGNPDCSLILCRVTEVKIKCIEIVPIASDNSCSWINYDKIYHTEQIISKKPQDQIVGR